MARILFLAHRIPYPPDKGDKIRAFHLLRRLVEHHQVWLGASADDPADLRHREQAGAGCAEVCIAPLGRVRRAANMLVGALAGRPLSVARFRHPQLERWIDKVLREVRPDVVLVYSSALAQYVMGRTGLQTRTIVDFVDADAEKWRAYAADARPPLRWVYAMEARRMARFDRQVLSFADAGLVITETERRLMAQLAPAEAAKLRVAPNGVDADYFRPLRGQAAPASRSVVLCGRMDYRPNIDGAHWFAEEILPRVRQEFPDAVFRIVGAEPAPSVLALGERPGVEVTGAVADVRPYLAEAAAVVAPLRIARGIQNKVLEGLAAARPVVATPQALDGIEAEVGREVLVGADADGFAAAVRDVLGGRAPASLGALGRAFVLRRHHWAAQLQVLDALMAEVGDASAQAPA